MLDFGFGELLLLGAIALIAIGPKQLPEVARTVGRFLNQLKDVTGDFQRTLAQASEKANQSVDRAVAEAQKTLDQVTPQISSHLDLKDHLPNLTDHHPTQPAEPDPQTSFTLNTTDAPAAVPANRDDQDPRQLSFDFDKKES